MTQNSALEETHLFVAATRPALLYGLPLEVGAFLLMMGGLIACFALPYTLIMVPLWWGASMLVRRDYNAPRVLMLWLKGPAFSLDSGLWGGASIGPFTNKSSGRYRGTAPDAW